MKTSRSTTSLCLFPLFVFPFVIATVAPVLAQAATWEQILTCDSGTVWVDIDSTERRNLQIVIRNPAAIKYLETLQVSTAEGSTPTEMIFRVRQISGIFHASQFTSAEAINNVDGRGRALPVDNEYMSKYTNHTYLYRDGQGIKIEFARSNMSICNFFDSSNGTCLGGRTHFAPSRYVGNWYFPSCF